MVASVTHSLNYTVYMIDGFPCGAADPDEEMQFLIDAELRNSHERIAEFERTYAVVPNAKVSSLVERVLRRPKADARYPQLHASDDRSVWLMPLLQRLTWHLAENNPEASWR